MDSSTPAFPVLHCLPEFTQTHVHWVSDAFQRLILCRPLLLLPSILPSIWVFSSESALHIGWPKYWSIATVLVMNIQGWFPLGLTGLIYLLAACIFHSSFQMCLVLLHFWAFAHAPSPRKHSPSGHFCLLDDTCHQSCISNVIFSKPFKIFTFSKPQGLLLLSFLLSLLTAIIISLSPPKSSRCIK